MFAVVMRYGSSERYRVLFVPAEDESEARFRAYNTDRLGSVVVIAEVPNKKGEQQ